MTTNVTVLMPLGYDTSGILRALSDHQLKSGDKFLFVVPSTENDRTKMMKTEIENAFSVLAMRGIKLEHEFLIVDENDFVKIFSAILDKITNESNRCIIVEIVGGLRIVCLALLMVTIMLPNRIEKVYAIPESSSARVSIPIPFINPQLTHTSRTILREIGKGTKTIDVLSNVLNKDKSTLNRQIRRLVEKGLIGQQRKGRITTYSLTLYGSACLANTHYSA